MHSFIGLIICGIFMGLAAPAQSLPASFFASQPLHRNPELDPQASVDDQQFALNIAKSPRYHHFFFLMPKTFQFLSSRQSPEIQAWIEKAIPRILKTPTGQKLCASATGGQAARISTLFGLGTSVANSLQSACTSRNPVHLPMRTERPREYLFVLTNDPEIPLEGWTTPQNVTYLFLTPGDLNEKFLLRVLIHELATQLDLKEQWGWLGNLSSFSEQVGARYEGAASHQVLSSLRHPVVKYALSALRAQALEDQILQELGFGSESNAASKMGSCTAQVLSMIPSILRVGILFLAENLLTFSPLPMQMLGGEFNIWSALQALEKEKVLDLETRQEVPLCDFMAIPKLGTFSFSPTMGGPRPRVQPWSKTSEAFKEAAENRDPETGAALDRLMKDPSLIHPVRREQRLNEILESKPRVSGTLRPSMMEEKLEN